MNEYRLEDLYVGQKEEFSVPINEQMLQAFKAITGDINPLHCDKNYAITQGFNNKVVYGMLTASFISTMGGVFLPGKFCLIHSVETKFLRPVYVGDTLYVQGEIKEIEKNFRQLTIKITIKNQHSEKVVRGILKAGVLKNG